MVVMSYKKQELAVPLSLGEPGLEPPTSASRTQCATEDGYLFLPEYLPAT